MSSEAVLAGIGVLVVVGLAAISAAVGYGRVGGRVDHLREWMGERLDALLSALNEDIRSRHALAKVVIRQGEQLARIEALHESHEERLARLEQDAYGHPIPHAIRNDRRTPPPYDPEDSR